MMTRSTSAAVASPAPLPDAVAQAVERATRLVAPVWPLAHFVAVNPFLGLVDRTFADSAEIMARTAGARTTMPRSYYADAIRRGSITDAHLATALAAASAASNGALPADVRALKALALAGDDDAVLAPLPTVADVVARLTGRTWPRFVTERISFWASAYFDLGQASWASPWRHQALYAAWHAEASIDRTPEILGAKGFRATVRALPATAAATTCRAVARLGLPAAALDAYLQRLVMTIGGWAAWARHDAWQQELYGGSSTRPAELLAVRLAWEVALLDAFAAAGADEAWAEAVCTFAAAPAPDLAADMVLQHAYELGWQDELIAKLGDAPPPVRSRPSAQAAFCIDVRSEVLRRHLEAIDPAVETIGFAGFFGFPIEYVPVGQEHGGAQCPVLLTPKIVIAETVHGAPASVTAEVGMARVVSRRVRSAWKAFKHGAVSCFAFVGPVGLAYARKLVTDGFGWTRPVPHPRADGVAPAMRARLGPTIEPNHAGARATGIAPADRAAMAEAVLRAMSLTGRFARLILLAGHGSTTVNNPHATGLDCGACGGHTGEANARVAAAVLNDPDVRVALRARGLDVPDDTIFLAGLHDTATDVVTIYDRDAIPSSHRAELSRLTTLLAEAGRQTRTERAPALGVRADAAGGARLIGRSRDWSQVRPEWGLAGCAAFIAAPRCRTAGVDLQGRAFLHSYAWRDDDGFGVLDLIMTAPMVVASWISLQYYGSTVDNRAFGSGNKTLHNVVGTIGVLEGNGGDLRTGLPWQSVHDGTRFVHEPLRLNVVIEAPIPAMNAVLARHAGVRALADHGWLHLWAMDDTGAVSHRYDGNLEWTPVPRRAVELVA